MPVPPKTIIESEAESRAQVVAKVAGRPLTRGELSAAFDLVANKSNWKMPIDCVVQLTGEQVEAIAVAVPFFAGCEASFAVVAQPVIFDNGGRAVLTYGVRARGYYAAVGA